MISINFCCSALGRVVLPLLIVIYPLSTLADEQVTTTLEKNPTVKISGPAHPEKFPKKNSREASIIRGETAFTRYCILCHGVNADGKGRAAKLFDPKPSNLRRSDKNTLYKVMIVSRGGKAMGRSSFMPQWDQELTTEQITDVVTYLNSIADNPPKD